MSELLGRNRYVIQQKTKLIELTNEFAIRDEEGNQIGMVREEGQSGLKKAARFLTSFDQFLTHRYGVYDALGQRVLEMTRPAKLVKSKVEVSDGAGQPVGRIVQQNVFGKIRFGLEDAAGQELGSINAENWRAWNFSIRDAAGTEVARITKTWEGLLRTAFTTADFYVLDVSAPLTGPLQLLVMASAVGVDTALKQDERGLN
jgi:uncharacterized protein YxjI